MSTALDLQSNEDEQPVVILPDGAELALMRREEMGPGEIARMTRMEREFKMLSTKIHKSGSADDKAMEKMAVEMDGLYRKFVVLLLPDMTPEQLAGLKTGMLVRIVQVWREHNGSNPTGGSQPTS